MYGCLYLEIRQNVYCNCLLTRLWRRKFWNQPYLFVHDQKVKKKIKYLQDEKSFKRAFKGLSLKQIKIFFFGSETPTLKEKILQDVKS